MAVNCDIDILKEKTEKLVEANYNEYYLRDDLYKFSDELTEISRNSSDEIKSEIEQLISKINKKLGEVNYSISMDPNAGMGNEYFYYNCWD